jgi:hypothetical protein
MARKTKEERLAARKEQEELRQAQAEMREIVLRIEYPARLMRALEEATSKNNYELEVRDGMFTLRDRDSRNYDNPLHLLHSYSEDTQNNLENLEWDLTEKAQERARRDQLYAVKQAALAKLSDEERAALGL